MAISKLPGCIGMHLRPWTPARTAGPLGYFDQGDPRLTTLLGDTPGPLGFNDWADPTLARYSLRGPRLPGMCMRTADGVALSVSVAGPASASAITPSVGTITVGEAQEMALKITTVFEGGKSMNYQALAGDFDGQGMSFGLIQWNFGQNTLGPLLKLMLAAAATSFAASFGKDADYDTLKKSLDDNKQADQLAWARAVQKDQKAAWKAAFTALGSVDAFNRIQREQAAAKYHPIVVKDIASLREISVDLLKAVEFRTYAALFDAAVQQNGIGKTIADTKTRVKQEKPETQLDLLKIAVTERADAANDQWVSDCKSRRLGILGGAAYATDAHEVAAKRENGQYGLITESGTKEVSGL